MTPLAKLHNETVTPTYNFHYGQKNPYLPGNVHVEGEGFIEPGAFPTAECCGVCSWPIQSGIGRATRHEVPPAIGNEAYVCTAEHSNEAIAQPVIGRVRDQLFSISIGTTTKGESAVWLADLKTTIAIAAEQVSGNLF
jgi:hypothetical protein